MGEYIKTILEEQKKVLKRRVENTKREIETLESELQGAKNALILSERKLKEVLEALGEKSNG